MASADCECCGVPTTAPEPIRIEPEECDCGCWDCDTCGDCDHHDDDVFVWPAVLCDECTEDGEGCGDGAWHCRCGCACDGSACPGPPQERLSARRASEFEDRLIANGVYDDL